MRKISNNNANETLDLRKRQTLNATIMINTGRISDEFSRLATQDAVTHEEIEKQNKIDFHRR